MRIFDQKIDHGPCIPLEKFLPNRRSVDPFIPLSKFGPIRPSMDPCIPFLKFVPIRPSIDPCILRYKFGPNRRSMDLYNLPFIIWTDSAIHESLPPSLKSVLNWWFVDPCITLQKLHQIDGPWIPAIPLSKFEPIQPSMGPCIPIFEIRTDSTVRGSLHPPFRNSDRFNRKTYSGEGGRR